MLCGTVSELAAQLQRGFFAGPLIIRSQLVAEGNAAFVKADQKKVPILSFNIGDIPSAEIASYLSEKGFALRGGLQCAAVTHTTLGTIEQGTVRFSPSAFSTHQQVTALSRTIKIFAANN